MRPPLPPAPWLVVGLARSGRAAARMLREHGETIACDSARPEELTGLDGVEVHTGTDGVELVERAGTVVKSPGVPQDAPVVRAARERGIEVTGELELAWRLIPNEFIAVTGTNGKTTTAELLGAIHRAAGAPVAVAGNVGTAVSTLAGTLDAGAVVVCECSSFQLEDTAAFAPECAVLLNIEEDHIDRHGSLEAYRRAKLRAFERQGPAAVAVAPAGLRPPGGARLVPFGGEGGEGVALTGEGLLRFRGEELMPAAAVRLRGRHNLQNAMAAAAAALARGVAPQAVRDALRSFRGVEHRLEEVAESGGVLYVNDSKATNVASAVAALEAFEGGVHAILGGSLKGGGFEGLREPLAERARAAYLIGEAADALARALDGAVPLRRCGDLDSAFAAASEEAAAGEVVLLSPACASYDQFTDFEERGRRFKALARAGTDQA